MCWDMNRPANAARQGGRRPESKIGVRFALEIELLIAKRRHLIVP